jgi:ABC-type hemin transport system ATPase subunit
MNDQGTRHACSLLLSMPVVLHDVNLAAAWYDRGS